VVSVHARNRQARLGFKIALAHLFAYHYGLSARLYYHLLMLSRAAMSARERAVAIAAAAAPVSPVAPVASAALGGETGAVVSDFVAELAADTTEPG
jgi:hypothetical protein